MSDYLEEKRRLTPFGRLCYWINERERIRIAKEQGSPKPWTNDPILQSYRFCNVIRMDDKVSQWLLNRWYKPNRAVSPVAMLKAVALARFLNRIETLHHIGFPLGWNPDRLKRLLRNYKESGNLVFGAAYIVRGGDGADKIEGVIDYFLGEEFQNYANKEFGDFSSMENIHSDLQDCYGFGSFTAGQVVADLRWAIPHGEWLDKNIWAPMGPGSRRGMNRLQGRPIDFPLKQELFLTELLVLRERIQSNLPESVADRLEMMDMQNCLCEFDKYNRVLFGEGTPKQRYPGAE